MERTVSNDAGHLNSDLLNEVPMNLPVFPTTNGAAHLGRCSVERNLEIINPATDEPNQALMIDQRKVGVSIEKSHFSGANIKPKIDNQQNFTVENMTIINYHHQPSNSINSASTASNDGWYSSSAFTPLQPPQLIQPILHPRPRPRMCSSKGISSSDKDGGSLQSSRSGFADRSRQVNRQTNSTNGLVQPRPSPRVRRTDKSTSFQSQSESVPVPQPLPQPRRGSRKYTEISDSIWFYNARPLRELSFVYDAIWNLAPENQRRIVVKLVPHSEENLKSVKAWFNLDRHPNIIQIFEYDVILSLVKEIYIAMELCSQNLRQFVNNVKDKPMNFRLHATYSKQLMTGLTFLHSSHIIHGNIKPDNILFSHDMVTIKISDSGLYKNVFHGEPFKDGSCCLPGTEGYRAPEVYFDPPELNYSSDVFSMGIVLFYIFTNGRHPFGAIPHDWGYNIRHYKNRDLSHLYHPQVPVLKKPVLFYMIDGALHRNADGRPTAKKVLENQFFEGVTSQINSNEAPATNQHDAGLLSSGTSVQKMVKSQSDDDLYVGNKAKLHSSYCETTRCYSLEDLAKAQDQPSEKHVPLPYPLLLPNEVGTSSRHKHPPSFSFIKMGNRDALKMDFAGDSHKIVEETPLESSPTLPREWYQFLDGPRPVNIQSSASQQSVSSNYELHLRLAYVERLLSTMSLRISASGSYSGISAHSSYSRYAQRSNRSESFNHSGRAATPLIYEADFDDNPSHNHFSFGRARNLSLGSLMMSEFGPHESDDRFHSRHYSTRSQK